MDFLHRHRLASAERRSLAELPEGVVARVVGRAAQLTEVLEAPLTGRPCVYYKVTITRPLLNLGGTLAHEERGVMFALDDGTERAVVDPTNCLVDLVVDERDASGADHRPTGREQVLLSRFNIEQKEWPAARQGPQIPLDRDFVYREAIIGVGEEIAILGRGMRLDADAVSNAAYRGTQPIRLHMSSSTDHPMIISDHPSTTR